MRRIYKNFMLAFVLIMLSISTSALQKSRVGILKVATVGTSTVYEAELGNKFGTATQYVKVSPNASGGKVMSDFSSWNAHVSINNIDGINGGVVTCTFRYSNKNATNGFLTCFVNSVKVRDLDLVTTGSADVFADITFDVTLLPGTTNLIRIANVNFNLADGKGVSGGVDVDKITITTKTDIPVQTIGLTPTEVSFTQLGEKKVLAPSILPNLATNKLLYWSSSNASVATVSQTGEVTAIANGEVQISATALDGGGATASTIVNVNSSTFNLVWSDEFNGTGLVDDTKWNYEGGFIRNSELQYYIRKDTSVVRQKNGNLEIVVRNDKPSVSKYVSGSIVTKAPAAWSYGRIEGRIKMPLSQGLWACFWTLGNAPNSPWPKNGEIDIFEHLNNENFLHTTAHWFDPTPRNNSTQTINHRWLGVETDTLDVTKWHLYSIEWTPNMLKWFVDGKQVHQLYIKEGVNETFAFHKPQFILLNMPIGGIWPGPPDATTVLPATMQVDYVKVYEWVPVAPQPVSFIEVDQRTVNVIYNHPVQLSTTIYPYNAANKSVTWSSSDNSIARVSSTGLVTGYKYGKVTITATTVDGSKTSACQVTVLDPTGINYAKNPGFELDQTAVQAPQKWSEWSSSSTAGTNTSTVAQGGAHSGNSKLLMNATIKTDVITSQTVDSLPLATYTLKAWVRYTGSLPYAYLDISGFGGSTIYASVTNTMTNWTQLTIPNIAITTGTCKLELYVSGNIGQTIEFDDVSLTINTESILTETLNQQVDQPSIYPTLVKEHVLNVSNPSAEDRELIIFNVSGQKLYSEIIHSGNTSINTSFLKSGIYVVGITTNDHVFKQKIVVQ